MAFMADMVKLAPCIEAIFPTATPRACLHPLADRLVTFDTSEPDRKNPLVFFDERFPSDFSPIRLFHRCLPGNFRFQAFGQGFSHRRKHSPCVFTPIVGIDQQCFFHELQKSGTGSFTKPFMAFIWPVERPTRQYAGDIFVKNQSCGETIASVGGVAIRLFRSNVARRAEVIYGFDAAFDF